MLEFDTGGTPITITPHREPPRPALAPFVHRGGIVPTYNSASGEATETVVSLGTNPSKAVRFVSSESQGILTHEQALAIQGLYDAGAAFTLTTDLLVPLGDAAEAYTARFQPDAPPTFAPVDPGGRLYYMDILLRIQPT